MRLQQGKILPTLGVRSVGGERPSPALLTGVENGLLFGVQLGTVGTEINHLGIFSQQCNQTNSRCVCTRWFVEARKCPLPQKVNTPMSFAATGMDLDVIILSKVSQTEKDKYRMISLICKI